MKFNNSIDCFDGQSYIIVKNGIVTGVSESLVHMTEYLLEELLNINIRKLFSILRIGPNVDFGDFHEEWDYFLFTKFLEVRFVDIHVTNVLLDKVYIFSEKLNSRLDAKFPDVEALCSHNKFGIAVFSAPDITLLKANQTYLNFLDKPFNNRENSIGKKIHEIISGWIGSSSNDIWKSVLSSQKPFYIDEYMFEFERGVTYWEASLAPVFENGILKYCIEITIDITEKVLNGKKMEEQEKIIEQQNKLLQAIVDSCPGNLSVIDSDGKYLFHKNQLLKNIPNGLMSIDDTYAMEKIYDVDGNELTKEKKIGYRVLSGEIVKDELIIIKTMEKEYYVLSHATPIYNEKGDFLYGIIGKNDVTQLMKSKQVLKETQEKLLAVERENNEALKKAIEMKDEFLSFISHEFKPPLNVINTAIQTLNFVYSEQITDKVKKYMGTIKQNTNRQLRLVNNILDITRSNSGSIKINKKTIDIVFLTKAITESVYEFASKKGVRITFVSKLRKKIIGIDDEKYERIILNLFSNAIKFTPTGETIIVTLYSVNCKICIEVKDMGIGIPPNKIDVIFERFGQVDSSLSRQAEGTGIGLSLVKKFVEALGGSITVDSKLGKGATFSVLLPSETVEEEQNENVIVDLMKDNRLIQTTTIEFSDIYL